MPRAVEEDLELAKEGLVVVLAEVQGTPAQLLPGFVMHVFPKLQARVCSGGGFPLPPFRGIPHTMVIGVDGTLLYTGSSFETKKIDAAVHAELEKVKKGFGATPEQRRVRALTYGKLEYAEAKKVLAAAGDALGAEQVHGLDAEIEAALAARLASLRHLLGTGRMAEAKELAAKLQAGTKGLHSPPAALAELVAALTGPEAEKECAADKQVADTLARYRAKSLPVAAATQALDAIAKKCAGTKTAARATAYANALRSGANAKK